MTAELKAIQNEVATFQSQQLGVSMGESGSQDKGTLASQLMEMHRCAAQRACVW